MVECQPKWARSCWWAATGDPAGRLLLPALGQLLEQEAERRDVVLVGAGTEEWSDEQWRDRVRSSLATAEVDSDTVSAILESTRYLQGDVTDVEDLRRLVATGPPAPAIYFALPPGGHGGFLRGPALGRAAHRYRAGV